MRRALYFVCAVAFTALWTTAARASDPLGFYAGGSFGDADVRSTHNPLLLTFAGEDLGWKIFFGARPLSFAGIEVAYMDFGHTTAPVPPPNFAVAYLSDNSRQRAGAIFGVGYLPLPVPFLDLYGKAGAARLDTREQDELGTDVLPGHVNNVLTQWSTDFAYGVGVQVRLGQFALRAEYERIDASVGDPALSSVGILWRF